MFISSVDFAKAFKQIDAVASIDKKPSGVKLEITDKSTTITYSTGSRAIERTIDSSVETGEVMGTVILDYDGFRRIHEAASCSGMICIDDIELMLSPCNTELKQPGICTVHIVKFIKSGTEDDFEKHVVSDSKINTNWYNTDIIKNNLKILARPFIENKFDSDNADTWERAELVRLLSAALAGECRAVNLSNDIVSDGFESVKTSLFSVGTNYQTVVNLDNSVSNPFIIDATTAKALVNCLSGLDNCDQLMLNTVSSADGKAQGYQLFNPDTSFIFYTACASVVKTDVAAIRMSSSLKYDFLQATVITEVLKDTVSGIRSAIDEKQNTVPLSFVRKCDDAGVRYFMRFAYSNSGSQSKNETELPCDMFNDVGLLRQLEAGEEVDVSDKTILTIEINPELLNTIISSNKDIHTAFDVELLDNKAVIRIGAVNLEEAIQLSNETKQEKIDNAVEAGEDAENVRLTIDDKLRMRPRYIHKYQYVTFAVAKNR